MFLFAGNTFSTLRGHRFEWLLLRDEEATHQTTEPESILHFVRFDDSSYSTDPIIGSLEAGGNQGDTVLVEGVSTGTAKVSVRFVDRVWKVWGNGKMERWVIGRIGNGECVLDLCVLTSDLSTESGRYGGLGE